MPHHLRLWWSLGFALLALITALSLLPIRGPDLDLPNSDKLHHALAYSVLMLYFGKLAGAGWQRRLAVAGGLLAYGIAIELLQSQLPPRTAELADLAANLGGMAIGALLLRTRLSRLMIAVERRLTSRTRL
jgi:VanZ family protein